jgi:hypothetical protein
MLRKMMMLTLMAVLSLVLVACGGGDAESGDGGGGDTPAVELAQELTSTDATGTGLTVSASVPEGWSAETEGQIIAATREELIAGGPTSGTESGDMLLLVTALPTEMAGVMVPEGDATPAAILEVFSGQFLSSIEGVDIGDVEDATVAGKAVSRVNATSEEGDFALYAFEQDAAIVIMLTGAASGEIGDRTATFEAILGSVEVQAASAE